MPHLNNNRGSIGSCHVRGGHGTSYRKLPVVSAGVPRDMTESLELAIDIHMPHVNINRGFSCSFHVRGGPGTDYRKGSLVSAGTPGTGLSHVSWPLIFTCPM